MKKKVIIIASALIVVLAIVILAIQLGNKGAQETQGTTKSSQTQTTTTTAPKEILPDVPANRYDATKTPRTGNNATNPLVVSTGTLDGKFSPFFNTSAYDTDVVDMTQLYLLFYNKDGAPEAGINVPSYAYDYKQEVSADNSSSTYTFILKNGITFSDGKPVTAKDVLFSIYVLCDPLYDGSSTYYTMNIKGMKEYRLQTTADTLEMVDKILEAGIKTGDNGEMVINPASGVTAAQQEALRRKICTGNH